VSTVRTSRGLDRFVTFVDAVVAIAITLLVLPLVDITADVGEQTLPQLLRSHTHEVYAFLLSFAVIARLWRAHHRLGERMDAYDGVVLHATTSWALTIVFLPFPTALVSVYGTDRSSIALYIGTILLSSACLSLVAWHVERTPALHREGVERSELSAVPSVVNTVLLAVALVLALLVPAVNFFTLLLLALAQPATRWWTRRRPVAGARPHG